MHILVFNVLFQTKSTPQSNYLILLKPMLMVITLFFVSSEAASNTEFLESQFATSSTLNGTQSHHQFISSASSLSLTMKKTSFAARSKEVSLADGGSSKVQTMVEDIKPGKFYMCQYDNDWYLYVANYMSSEDGDVNMKFLYFIGHSEKLFWPQFQSRMYIVKLMYLQLAVLDGFIVLTKKTMQVIESCLN